MGNDGLSGGLTGLSADPLDFHVGGTCQALEVNCCWQLQEGIGPVQAAALLHLASPCTVVSMTAAEQIVSVQNRA